MTRAAELFEFRRALLSKLATAVSDSRAPASQAGRPAWDCSAVAPLLIEGREPSEDSALPGLEEVQRRAGGPGALRYLILTTQYRSAWNFSWSGLAASVSALEALARRVSELQSASSASDLSAEGKTLRERFADALANDLDTPAALSVVWQVVRASLPNGERRQLLLEFDRVLELGLVEAARAPGEQLPAEVLALIDQRDAARRDRDWARSDALRDQLAELGVEARDTPSGSVYQRNERASERATGAS